MTRLICIICLSAVLSAIGQNRGDLWVMTAIDCPILPTENSNVTVVSEPVCFSETESWPRSGGSGCCSEGCPAEDSAPLQTCGMEDFGPSVEGECSNPEEGKKRCKLIHPLWADIPHKAITPIPSLVQVTIFTITTSTAVERDRDQKQSNRPWGIHPSIASTVLRI